MRARQCRLRHAGGLRGAGGAGREVRHAPASQRRPGAGHPTIADSASGLAERQTGGPVQELSLPSGKLEKGGVVAKVVLSLDRADAVIDGNSGYSHEVPLFPLGGPAAKIQG